jgi:hypothetical protein
MKDQMITPDEEKWILTKAYVPEHIINLMVTISKGRPFLSNGYLYYVGDAWGILIGYPLNAEFTPETFTITFKDVIGHYPARTWWIIGPSLPEDLLASCGDRQPDAYYTLNFRDFDSTASLRRVADKATSLLMVEVTRSMTSEHQNLINEFVARENPGSLIRELYRAMPDYILHSKTSLVLNARAFNGLLAAFYVVDMAAHDFATYVVGCHSKEHYVPHASDLLFFEMVTMTREWGKSYVNLGLGVNQGIRKFKEKWGGKPTRPYEFCEYHTGISGMSTIIDSLLTRL